MEAAVDGAPDAGASLLQAVADATTSEDRAALLDPLARAAGNSGRALELLLTAVHREHLARPAIHRLIIDHHDAEEVEQDVLIAVARSIGGYRGDARFTTWLGSIARNVAIDSLRRRKQQLSLDDAGPLGASAQVSSMIANRQILRSAIENLEPRYRHPVALRDVEQLPYAEIAERLGLKLNTTRSRIARGRALLAASLGPEEPVGGHPNHDHPDHGHPNHGHPNRDHPNRDHPDEDG